MPFLSQTSPSKVHFNASAFNRLPVFCLSFLILPLGGFFKAKLQSEKIYLALERGQDWKKGEVLGNETPSKHMNIHTLKRHIHHAFLNKTWCSCTWCTHPSTGAYLGTFTTLIRSLHVLFHLLIWGPTPRTSTCFLFYLRSAIQETQCVWVHKTVNTHLAAPNAWPW